MRYINTSSTISLVDIVTRLNTHIEKMNKDGWEILSVSIESVGIQKLLVIFWKKPVSE